MTSQVSAIESIEKAMEGESIDRIAQNFHSCEDALPWGRQKSSYRGTVRKTVRSMIEAMRAAGFEVVSRRDLNSFARQTEALQLENARFRAGLGRLKEATPISTNSSTAKEAFSFVYAVAATALLGGSENAE